MSVAWWWADFYDAPMQKLDTATLPNATRQILFWLYWIPTCIPFIFVFMGLLIWDWVREQM